MWEKYVVGALIGAVVLITAYSTYYISDAIQRGVFCALDLPIPVFIPLFFLLGLFTGLLIHRLFESRPVPPRAVASLFDKEEEAFIIQTILERGSILQSEVSHRFGKVRASRAVAALEARELVRRERVGKTYVIVAGPALRKVLGFNL